MNRILLESTGNFLRAIADTPGSVGMTFNAHQIADIQRKIDKIAVSASGEFPFLSSHMFDVKNNLFGPDQFGRMYINPFSVGQLLLAIDYLLVAESGSLTTIWSFIHPRIQKASKKMYLDGHYADAALKAFIEVNDRAKEVYSIKRPNDSSLPDGVDLMHKLFGGDNPICQVCDMVSSSDRSYQEGFHFLTAGSILAYRNPKAHSNCIVLSAEESARRLMLASSIMFELDAFK